MQRSRSLSLMIAAALGLLLIGAGRAGAAESTEFRSVDTKKDHQIDLKEFLDAAEKTFETLDANKDSALDPKELEPLEPAVRESLGTLDLNSNGKLDRQEFLNGASARFHELDTNKDGVLDPDEADPKKGPGFHPFIIFRF